MSYWAGGSYQAARQIGKDIVTGKQAIEDFLKLPRPVREPQFFPVAKPSKKACGLCGREIGQHNLFGLCDECLNK